MTRLPGDQARLRHARQLGLEGLGAEGQAVLEAATVAVFGLGGLGSAASLYLAAAGVGRLLLIDGDRVEPSNLNRQVLYGERSLGGSKAELARARLLELDPGLELEAHPVEVDEAGAAALCAGAELALDCLDNFPSRHALNRAAVATGTPLVVAACEALEGRLTVVVPGQGPCLRCLVPDAPDVGGRPILGATAGLLGAMQALEAVKLLTGLGERLVGRMAIVDARSWSFELVRAARDPACPVCGTLE